jgi:hypothetical protein
MIEIKASQLFNFTCTVGSQTFNFGMVNETRTAAAKDLLTKLETVCAELKQEINGMKTSAS